MNIVFFQVALLFSATGIGAEPVAKVKASIHACDMSVIESSLVGKSWKDMDAREWTVIKMENSFALCLFSDRYLLFSETRNNLVSVEEVSGGIAVSFKGETAHAYLVDSQDLLSRSLPYRGYPAETAYWARVTYDKKVSTKVASLILRMGSSPEKRLDAGISRFGSQNPFWSNPGIVKEVKRWALEERGKETWESLNNLEPYVELLLDIPRGTTAASFEETVPGTEKQSAAVSLPNIEVARFVCMDDIHAGENSPHKSLMITVLLPLLHEKP